MPVASRTYADETDYERMRALLRTIVARRGVPTYCTVGDLDWWRFTDEDPDAVHKAQLWLDGDDVVAIAWSGGTQVDLMTHPNHRVLENEMLAWAEDRHSQGTNAEKPFHAWSFGRDTSRIAVLHQRGYTSADECFVSRTRSLDASLAKPFLPPGFTLRHVQDEADLERRVDVHRAAFAPSRMTAAKHRAVMAAPTYRADLDLIVIAPEDVLRRFALCGWMKQIAWACSSR